MAIEHEVNGTWFVQGDARTSDLHIAETLLFESVTEVEHWGLADEARRALLDATNHFSRQVPAPVDHTLPLEKWERSLLMKKAVIGASMIAIRSIGSGMALIACGYVQEALASMRRAKEARLNGRAVLDDQSGNYAIHYLKGRMRGLTKLAGEYEENVEAASQLVHGGLHGLGGLRVSPEEAARLGGDMSVEPARRIEAKGDPAAFALYLLALDAVLMGEVLANAFGEVYEVSSSVAGELHKHKATYGVTLEGKPPEEWDPPA